MKIFLRNGLAKRESKATLRQYAGEKSAGKWLLPLAGLESLG
jgi:hypothetical protein